MEIVFAMTLFELYKYIGKDDEQVKVKSGVLDNTGVGLTTSYDDSISHYVDMSEVEIVDNIRVAKYMSFRNGKFVKYPTTDEVFVDPHKEYKDIFTEFITMQFFKSPESLFNFLEAICTTFELAFSAYRSKYNIKDAELFFIYKGGNVLRIIANDFLKEFPAHANKLLISKYEKYFGRSDCDFSVYIKPEINDYEQVFKDITLISYILQVKLRKQFMAEPSKYFDFYKYNVEYQKQLLNECFKKIVKSTALSDPKYPKVYRSMMIPISVVAMLASNEINLKLIV
jgi:hypothetical protein